MFALAVADPGMFTISSLEIVNMKYAVSATETCCASQTTKIVFVITQSGELRLDFIIRLFAY